MRLPAGGAAARLRCAAASRHAVALTGCLLGVFALAEQVSRLALGASQYLESRPAAAPAVAGSAPAGTAGTGAGIAHAATASPSVQAVAVLLLLCLATTLPLAFPRPAAAVVALSAAIVLSLAAFQTLTLAGLAAAVLAQYRLGRAGPAVLAPVLAVPFLVLALAGTVTGAARPLAVLLACLGPAAALAGIARRARSEAAEHGAERQVIAGSLLEHTARGERARIARELHDVVAHHISMIAVQAETARLATPGMPPAGAQRLLDIGDTARAALTEMRRLLGVLREDARAGAPGQPAADRQPQPGLRELAELLDQARDATGSGVRLILRGPPAPLDPGAELATYRIVQESLTNARRHAPGAAIDVELHFTDAALRVRVRDNGPGTPGAVTAGHGLLGMRERAAAVGGELRAGPVAGGGFLVEAVLPVKAEAAA